MTRETLEETSHPLSVRLRDWVVNHDDSWLFTVLYVVLAVVLSIWISLFWLVAVVAVHFVFEWVRHRHSLDDNETLACYALWNIKLDVALVIFALSLTAYMEVILGFAGLGGATRLGVQSAARLGGWARVIRGILLSLDDAAQVARAAVNQIASNGNRQLPEASGSVQLRPWQAPTRGDYLSLGFAASCVVSILAAPWLTDHTYASLGSTLLRELHPFPSAD